MPTRLGVLSVRDLAAMCVAVAGLAGAGRLAAQERAYVVIVNEANTLDNISAEELSQLFMKRTTTWPGGEAVVPVDLPDRSMTRANFSQDVHRKSTAEIKSFWQAALFAGRAVPPVEAASEAAALAYVRSTPGAIAYVYTSTALGQGVRAVRIRS